MDRSLRNRLLRLAVTVAVLAVLALGLDLRESWRLLRGIRIGPALMAVGLLAGSHALVALVWRFLLERTGIEMKIERAIRLYFSGLFLNNFFLGSVGGDSYRIWSARQEAGSGRRALAATLIERIIGVIALLLLGFAAAAAAPDLPPYYRLVLLAVSGAGSLSGVAMLFFPDRMGRLLLPLVRRLQPRLAEKAQGVFEGMRRAGRARNILAGLLVLLAAQGVRIWTHWWCAQALGLDVAARDMFLAIPIVAFAAGLPISVGGLGVREGMGVLMLGPLGIAQTEAVAVEALAYLVGVATSLIGGLPFLTGRQPPPPEGAGLGSSHESARIES